MSILPHFKEHTRARGERTVEDVGHWLGELKREGLENLV